MCQAYQDHLRSAGVRRLSLPPHLPQVHLAAEGDGLAFDGAQAISFSAEPPEDLPPDYEPGCGTRPS